MTQGHVEELLVLAVDGVEGRLGLAQRKLVGC
jgi:hypothetical protein